MTRTNAREIVAQLVYEMGFRDDDAAAVVREHLDPDYYATLKDESDAYQDRPTGKQAEYIQSTLCGIRERQEPYFQNGPRHHAACHVRVPVCA